MKTILDKVEDILFEPGGGLIDRFRDEEVIMTEEEKEILLEFASDVNKKIIDNKVSKKEIYICLKIIIIFDSYEEAKNFVTGFYNNLVKDFEF